MLIVVVAALFGVWRCRSSEYFKWVAILFVWMLTASLLFYADGTLEDPTGDGLITREIRRATDDGPGMGIFAIAFLIVYWGGAIFFITRMVRAARAFKASQEAMYDDPDFVDREGDNTTRRVFETLALLAAAALWIWFWFLRPPQLEVSQAPAAATEQSPQTPQKLTIEQEVLGVAADINANVPQRIDEQTVLERATASGRTLTYHYRIDPKGGSPEELRTFIRKNVVPKVCTGSLRQSMKDPGVAYVYSYAAPSFREPVSVSVDEKMCASLEG